MLSALHRSTGGGDPAAPNYKTAKPLHVSSFTLAVGYVNAPGVPTSVAHLGVESGRSLDAKAVKREICSLQARGCFDPDGSFNLVGIHTLLTSEESPGRIAMTQRNMCSNMLATCKFRGRAIRENSWTRDEVDATHVFRGSWYLQDPRQMREILDEGDLRSCCAGAERPSVRAKKEERSRRYSALLSKILLLLLVLLIVVPCQISTRRHMIINFQHHTDTHSVASPIAEVFTRSCCRALPERSPGGASLRAPALRTVVEKVSKASIRRLVLSCVSRQRHLESHYDANTRSGVVPRDVERVAL